MACWSGYLVPRFSFPEEKHPAPQERENLSRWFSFSKWGRICMDMFWVWHPPRIPVTTRTITSLVGIPINLHMPLLLGGGPHRRYVTILGVVCPVGGFYSFIFYLQTVIKRLNKGFPTPHWLDLFIDLFPTNHWKVWASYGFLQNF